MWSGRNTWYINPPRIKIEGYGKSAKKSPVHNSTALIYDTKWEQNTELVTKMSGHYVNIRYRRCENESKNNRPDLKIMQIRPASHYSIFTPTTTLQFDRNALGPSDREIYGAET
jgi:hypothetical protein